jgi:hypothetical protein
LQQRHAAAHRGQGVATGGAVGKVGFDLAALLGSDLPIKVP